MTGPPIPAPLALLTPDGLVAAADPAALAAAGLDVSGLIGRPFAEAAWWTHDPGLPARIHAAVAGARDGSPAPMAAGLGLVDGTALPVELAIAALCDAGGRVTHLAPAARVTGADGLDDGPDDARAEAARLRQRLADERARFDAVVEQIPAGVLLAEAPGGRIVYGNGRIADLLGHPVLSSADVDAYREWVAWHADGRPVEAADWPLARALRGEDARGDFLYRRGDGARVWVRVRGAPIRDADGTVAGGMAIVTDIDAEKRAERALHEADQQKAELLAQYASFLANAPVGFALFDTGHRYARVNDALARINGMPALEQIGRSVGEVVPALAASIGGVIDHVLATGSVVQDVPLSGETAAAPGLTRHWLASFYPVETDGEVTHVGNVVVEITARRRAEERQRALIDELSHRVKNTLATVQSLATQSLRGDPSPAAFARAFTGRLASLAHTHDLLARSGWQGARLADLVRAALGPLQSAETQRLSADGPDIALTPTAALTFGLALHELAANAAAYGALSTPGGHVDIGWQVAGEAPRLVVEWRERGGPAVAPPVRHGFGLRFIGRSFAHELDGEAEFAFPADGMVCRIGVPWTEAGETERRYMALQDSAAAWSRPD